MELLESLEIIGPGRYADHPVLAQKVCFAAIELEAVNNACDASRQRLLRQLGLIGIVADPASFAPPPATEGAALTLGKWYARTAVLLQQWAGHRVSFVHAAPCADPAQALAVTEFEDVEVGCRAAELARELVVRSLGTHPPAGEVDTPATGLESFRALAAARVLPGDTEVLVDVARARGLPAFKLDREPYEPLLGDFRIRDNGMLRFGHACHQHIVDGTFCVDRSAAVLEALADRLSQYRQLRAAGLPIPVTGSRLQLCLTVSQARRVAERTGYPVVIKSATPKKGVTICNVSSESELESAVRLVQQQAPHFLVERQLAGDTFRVMCAGQQFHAVVAVPSGREVTEIVDASIIEATAILSSGIPVGVCSFDFVTTDPGRPLQETGGAFINLNVAPELDSVLPVGSELHRSMVEDFLTWLIPEGQACRIPIFSVTGTNGKTTTCRMLARIMKNAGYRVGLACTDGIYFNDVLIDRGDRAGRNGHHRVFESWDIDLAVLETARGSVLNSGFTFDWSDVAVCTNVTPDHLGQYGIETVEQMGDIKCQIVQRARTCVVLNADDPECRRMVPRLADRRICWCSMELGAADLARTGMGGERFVVLERTDGDDWIVSRQAGQVVHLVRVGDIPATFGGVARHNVINAMQGIAAALEFGIDADVVRRSMTGFSMGIDTTPGRLNINRDLGFPVLLDFVQNIDAMRRLREFSDGLEIDGKRILVISVLGRHDDATVREFARLAAAGFDRFICRNYGKTYHRAKEEIPDLLRAGLLESGVAASDIFIIHEETAAIDAALGLAGPGDLVVILCGTEPDENWQQIAGFVRNRIN